jgi:hypothetical protein
MSKRKRKPSQPPAAPAPTPTARAAPEQTGQRRSRPWLWVGLVAVLVAGVALVAWLAGRGPATAAPAATATGPIGGVTGCRQQPKFTQDIGFSRSALLSTAERTVKGMILYDPQPDGPPRAYQHPSWSSAGYLGPNAIDKDGNIYVAPAPRVNLIDNPPANQNKVHRVDTATGVMSEYVNLPAVQAPSLSNPYGILGMAYDCDTHSLYVSSVAGSTRRDENGRIFRIDLAAGKVAAVFEGTDAIGVAVFNGSRGKRLYFGSARTQDVRSIALDHQGDFTGTPRSEFSLQGLGPEGNDKVRKITFERGEGMVVNGTKFNYNLAPPPAQQRPTAYRYRYAAATDSWSFVSAAPSAMSAQ